jgi:hypothetical protein
MGYQVNLTKVSTLLLIHKISILLLERNVEVVAENVVHMVVLRD